MIKLILTIAIAFLGGWAALRLKLPAGAMIGAMIAVAVFNVITGEAFIPQNVKTVTQILAGAFIGIGITYKDIHELRYILKPVVFLVSGMLILSLLIGFTVYKSSGLDLATSLFSSAPGGVMDMSLISTDLGANASQVALLQLIRVLTVMGIFPALIKYISSRFGKEDAAALKEPEETASEVDANIAEEDKTQEIKNSEQKKTARLIMTCLVAFVSGFIGYFLKIPAGAVTFAMAGTAALNIFSGTGYMPISVRKIVQVFSGALLGSGMTLEDLIALRTIIVPALILVIGLTAMNLCIGFLIYKTTPLDLATCLFASAPGGVSDMTLIAHEFGADTPKIAVMQLSRLVSVIALYPLIIKLLL